MLQFPTREQVSPYNSQFKEGLKELGFVEGLNVVFEERFADATRDRLPVLAAELVRLSPDVIVVTTNEILEAARQATRTIPIVTVLVTDPVDRGIVASLGRPGGNITGLTFDVDAEIYAKRLELLKIAVGTPSQVAVFWNPAYPSEGKALKAAEDAAPKLGLRLHSVEVPDLNHLEEVFAAVVRRGAEALLVMGDPLIFQGRRQIADLAARHRLATIYAFRAYVEAGGLMSYGPNGYDLFRRVATYVAKILRGARPGDLPMEQPTTFEFVVNLKAAKAIGLTIPQSLLLRADQVIE